jgi:PadR family transcriptional regulator, regulatory protein PadR
LDHTLTTGKEFRIGWLLFLLRSSASSGYGYDLRRELQLRGVALDPAVLYRSLREMESRTLIASHWVHSEEGPRRRVYSITAAGEAELARIASSLRASRNAHDVFLAAYDRPAGRRGGGGGAGQA